MKLYHAQRDHEIWCGDSTSGWLLEGERPMVDPKHCDLAAQRLRQQVLCA